jgi:putative membrane protein
MKVSRKAHLFFSVGDKERIKEKTREIEGKTSGEIAVVVVDKGGRYREAEFLGAITAGNIVSLLLTLYYFHESIWWYVPFTFVFFFPFLVLFQRFPFLTIGLAGRMRINEAVKKRALQAFYEKGLYKTKDQTGVLFFISLLERKVWILADKGIHEKIKQSVLNKFAGYVSQGIREGHPADALIEAMDEVGKLLAQHYPRKADDVNELSDGVMLEDKAE